MPRGKGPPDRNNPGWAAPRPVRGAEPLRSSVAVVVHIGLPVQSSGGEGMSIPLDPGRPRARGEVS